MRDEFDQYSSNLRLVVLALARTGGESDLQRIYQEARRLRPTWHEQYRNEKAFEGSLRNVIECHCPQSANYKPERLAVFERITRGRYRLVARDDRDRVKKRGRRLGQ